MICAEKNIAFALSHLAIEGDCFGLVGPRVEMNMKTLAYLFGNANSVEVDGN